MSLRRRSRLAAVGLVVGGGAIVIAAIVWWWLSQMPERLIRKAIAAASAGVLQTSDSVYRLTFGPFAYERASRNLTFDWIRLETDTSRNRSRAASLPLVTAVVRGTHIEKLGLPSPIGPRRTLSIGTIHLDDVRLRLSPGLPGREESSNRRIAAGATADTPAETDRSPPKSSTLEWWSKGTLPKAASRIRITHVELPRVTIELDSAPGLPRRVPRLSLRADEISAGPPAGGGTPVRIGNVWLRAEGYSGVWDSLTSVDIARIELSAADSVLRIDSVEVRPTLDLAAQRKRNKWRRTRIGASIAAITAHGVDCGALLRSGTVAIRTIDVATPKLDLLVDRKPQPDPRPEPARMPNRVMRQLAVRVAIDTVRADNGTIVYGELEPWRRRPGIVTFEHVHGTAVNVSNVPGRMSDTTPMVFTGSARFMGNGRFSTVLEIPLLADRFRMKYRGNLGPMPMIDFNRFIAVNTPAKVRRGEALGLTFDARVVDDHATGRLIPQYRDFKIGINKRGGGLFAKIGRHIGSFFFNNFKLRTDNPEDDGKGRLAVGRIDRRREPAEQLFPFLWSTLRDPLREVMTP
jgi:hypothetical protein